MSHFKYLPMFGETKEDIIETIKYLAQENGEKAHIPREESIIEVPQLKIWCFLPVYHEKHFLEAKVSDDTLVLVNTNALEHILKQLKSFEELKCGALYRFSPGQYFSPGRFPYVFLPERVMKAMRDYNWAQHNDQLREWGLVEQEFWQQIQDSNRVTLMGLSRFKNKRKKAPRMSKN